MMIHSNMKEKDFGEYRLQYKVNAIMLDRKLFANVSIEMDTTTSVTSRIAGIAVGVLFLILIIGFILLCLAMKMDILWFYKMTFGPYETGTW